jgi:hypothetical protein
MTINTQIVAATAATASPIIQIAARSPLGPLSLASDVQAHGDASPPAQQGARRRSAGAELGAGIPSPGTGPRSMYASPPPPSPPTALSLLAFSSPPRTDIAPWRLPDAYEFLPTSIKAFSADPLPLKKKKKNRAAQAERVRRELQLVEGGGVESVAAGV